METTIAYFGLSEVRSVKLAGRQLDSGVTVQENICTIIDVYLIPDRFDYFPIVARFFCHRLTLNRARLRRRNALLHDAKANEECYSERMAAVGGDERGGGGVGGELCARGGEEVWGDAVVAVVAEGVGGDVADGGFGEVGWECGAGGEEEFVGAAGVFDARPDVVAGVELEEGFEEVAVFFSVVGE